MGTWESTFETILMLAYNLGMIVKWAKQLTIKRVPRLLILVFWDGSSRKAPFSLLSVARREEVSLGQSEPTTATPPADNGGQLR
jgi:hypothetical protein